MKTIQLDKHQGFPHLLILRTTEVQLSHYEHIAVGDIVWRSVWNPASNSFVPQEFRVNEVLESRPSKGNWGGAAYPYMVQAFS